MALNPEYRAKRAANLGNALAATTFKTAEDATKVVTAYLKGSNATRHFRITVVGWAKSGTTSNFTGVLRKGNDATPGNNTTVATTGAQALASGQHNFRLVFEGTWDGQTQKIAGRQLGHFGAAAIAAAAGTAVITGQDPAGSSVPFSFDGLFSATDPANDAVIERFDVEVD